MRRIARVPAHVVAHLALPKEEPRHPLWSPARPWVAPCRITPSLLPSAGDHKGPPPPLPPLRIPPPLVCLFPTLLFPPPLLDAYWLTLAVNLGGSGAGNPSLN